MRDPDSIESPHSRDCSLNRQVVRVVGAYFFLCFQASAQCPGRVISWLELWLYWCYASVSVFVQPDTSLLMDIQIPCEYDDHRIQDTPNRFTPTHRRKQQLYPSWRFVDENPIEVFSYFIEKLVTRLEKGVNGLG